MRVVFAVIFIGGGISHLVLGRVMPDSYAAFGQTPIFGWMRDLWASWVMPNIGRLTLVLGIFEICCGIGIAIKRTALIAVWAILAFLVFITINGYGLPAASLGEDILKNRATTILMALLLIPLLTSSWRTASERLNRRREASATVRD
jgi:uncharacterized membrane protein